MITSCMTSCPWGLDTPLVCLALCTLVTGLILVFQTFKELELHTKIAFHTTKANRAPSYTLISLNRDNHSLYTQHTDYTPMGQ